jgi:hypothetical protein
MTLPNDEAEALRRCLSILAPSSTPIERRAMALNVEDRIAGRQTAALALTYSQFGTLFHPDDRVQAEKVERRMQHAVERGELVTIVPPNHKMLLLTELCVWPQCPPVSEDSPLRYWLPMLPTLPAAALGEATERTEQASEDDRPRELHGRRLWRLREGLETIAKGAGSTSAEALMPHAAAAIGTGALMARDIATGLPIRGSGNLADFLDWFFAEDLNRWLDAVGAPFAFRLPEDAAAPAGEAPAVQEVRGRRVKRQALIADNLRRWPTIERDLKDAAVNGLSSAARDKGAPGWWWEGSALAWARERDKVRDAGLALAGAPGRVHRLRG